MNHREAKLAKFAELLSKKLKIFPEDFYSSFKYTTTGKNWTHPTTLPLIVKTIKEIYQEYNLAFDLRLNNGGIKFQPDIICFKDQPSEENIELVIDYESPNSSDNRIIPKDVNGFLNYRKYFSSNCVYIIITTLPNFKCLKWQLRYTTFEYYNAKYKGQVNKVKENPFVFWYSKYKKHIDQMDISPSIFFLNISGNNCFHVNMNNINKP